MSIQKDICRTRAKNRKVRRYSKFWVGLYGGLRADTFELCH
ncbi:hypothetical protein Xen7305DRAFT_00021330 [Xenococcus sp. PCC 7305]|nr:hypothetical protein [Xenococcus sp. PCC 7305]ELS02419.1 hypothetical protein Xen7305DRAFT_00021330 [Xenococcus sp. PCC 7305]